MEPFVVNRHGRWVFAHNFWPDLDFSVFDALEQCEGGRRPEGDGGGSRMEKAGRGAEEIGAVLVCSCTSSWLLPSLVRTSPERLCGYVRRPQPHL